MSVFTGGPYGRLAVMLNTISSLNIEIIIIIIIRLLLSNLVSRQGSNDHHCSTSGSDSECFSTTEMSINAFSNGNFNLEVNGFSNFMNVVEFK